MAETEDEMTRLEREGAEAANDGDADRSFALLRRAQALRSQRDAALREQGLA